MAMMINCAQDWTYDLFIRDIERFGDEDKSGGTDYNEGFVSYLKRNAKRFLDDWKKKHDGKLYDGGYVGDAFAERILDWFSDYYKDTYNQRPHLPMWFYVHPLGLPMEGDTARLFCASPMDDAMEMAKQNRENLKDW